MTSKAKRYSCLIRQAILLVMIWTMLPAGELAARVRGEHDTNSRPRFARPPAALKTAPGNRSQQRPAQNRVIFDSAAGKRDPFEVPPPPEADGGGDDMVGRLPPGVRGLVIGQLHLRGIVRDEESGMMIAVVTNRSNLAYFLRLHEEVYNGVVSRITPDAVYFQRKSRDSGNRTQARAPVLRLGSEQQEAR